MRYAGGLGLDRTTHWAGEGAGRMASAAAAGQPSRVTGRVQCTTVWKQTTGGGSARVGGGMADLLAFGNGVSLPAGGPQQWAIP